jgi:CheY-like chemotaxis protein
VSASILVADDEPNIVLSLEFLLKQAGFRVRSVSDGGGSERTLKFQAKLDVAQCRTHTLER